LIRQLREMASWYFREPSFYSDFKRHKTVDRKARLTGSRLKISAWNALWV
jgi:hypothetical protein